VAATEAVQAETIAVATKPDTTLVTIKALVVHTLVAITTVVLALVVASITMLRIREPMTSA